MSATPTDTRSTEGQKISARKQFRDAVNSGSVANVSSCQICGGTRRVHPHHADYSKPFNVVWLCSKCHGMAHSAKKGKWQREKGRCGNQMNMYLSNELAARVDAVGLALTKKDGQPRTRQDVFKMAFEQWTALMDTLQGKSRKATLG